MFTKILNKIKQSNENLFNEYNLLIEKKEISIYEKQNIIDMYEVYKKLECCDIIEDLIKKLDNIPIK